jgi:guanylate kinase
MLVSNALGPWGYYIYKDEYNFGGKLDQKTFIELIEKIEKYYATKLAKNPVFHMQNNSTHYPNAI